MHVTINPETCDFSVYAEREVKEFVDDPALEISLVDAQKINTNAEIGDMIKLISSQGIRTYCDAECKECNSSENP